MTVKIDIAEAAEKLETLHARLYRPGRTHQSIAVVVPLAEGQSEVVSSYLEEGPPFDPGEIGLTGHKVYLTEREAVFVFETEEGIRAFERILAEPELWQVVSAWEHSSAEPPRIAAAVYDWCAQGGHGDRGREQ